MTEDLASRLMQGTGFDWDAGNAAKIVARHDIQPGECEQVFFRRRVVVSFDEKHSTVETRWQALGRTTGERWLFLVFTFRGTLIRVLQAREMNRKERDRYAEIKTQAERDSGL